jgi:hypothetical protein
MATCAATAASPATVGEMDVELEALRGVSIVKESTSLRAARVTRNVLVEPIEQPAGALRDAPSTAATSGCEAETLARSAAPISSPGDVFRTTHAALLATTSEPGMPAARLGRVESSSGTPRPLPQDVQHLARGRVEVR